MQASGLLPCSRAAVLQDNRVCPPSPPVLQGRAEDRNLGDFTGRSLSLGLLGAAGLHLAALVPILAGAVSPIVDGLG